VTLMTSRMRFGEPRMLLGLLVVVCGLIAVVSIARTSGWSGDRPSGAEIRPTFDPSKLTEVHPKGAIPSLDAPAFESIASADWLDDAEPVVAVEIDGDARAYPIQILTWHEIVNDRVAGQPIAVTYCPQCNSAVTFKRPEIDGETATFGTSGSLYRSNLLMYDRTSDSLWPQLTGIAERGRMAGSQLLRLPSPIVSWKSFRAAFPDGRVLSHATGFDRPYGENPHPGYDTRTTLPFDVDVAGDDRLPIMERVLGVRAGDDVVAYPFSDLERRSRRGLTVVNDEVGGEPIVVIWLEGTLSAVDEKNIADSRDVGSTVAFSRDAGGDTLHLEGRRGRVLDRESGSIWNIFGKAIRGPRNGDRLKDVDTIEAFWFTWAAFHPRTSIWD
jgi:hypothetical protein